MVKDQDQMEPKTKIADWNDRLSWEIDKKCKKSAGIRIVIKRIIRQ